MKVLYLLTFFLFAVNIDESAAQQTTIRGSVTDATTGEVLPGVNVYISGTTEGASTKPDGSYEFSTALIGRQDLVASFIGYRSTIQSINLGESPALAIDLVLIEDVVQLTEIQVTASNNEFLKQLDLFKRFFIGFDSNANQTFIRNSEVLDFEENQNGNQIIVSASSPLIIENLALGYLYEVEIRQAYFNPQDNTGMYKIYPRIIELEAPNRRTQRRWNANRKDSYEGSSRHFFKSLTEDRLRRNKFRVVPSEDILVNYSDSLSHLQRWFPNNLEYIRTNFEVYLFDADAFRVEYQDGELATIGQQFSEPEMSSFRIRGFPEIIVVNENGHLLNPERMSYFGEWSNTRFSEFLPLDYER